LHATLRLDVRVFGQAYYWSAREEALRACVGAILHKARDADRRSTRRRFGLRDAQPTSHEAVSADERMGSS
jgi:hypothetical protein